jgi:uncharacterized protein
MKIQIAGLSEGLHQYHFQEKAHDLGLSEEFAGEVQVEAALEKTGAQMYLQASIATVARFVCDRCACVFDAPVASSYHMFYVWDGMEADSRLDPSEVQVLPHGLGIIDIAEDVRQTVVLAVPLKLLCRPDCRGLCPRCGTDLNKGECHCIESERDSRWDALRGFSPADKNE